MSDVRTKQFWIEDDDFIKPHLFVFHSDHLAAMEALREAKDREIEGLRKEVQHLNKLLDYSAGGRV